MSGLWERWRGRIAGLCIFALALAFALRLSDRIIPADNGKRRGEIVTQAEAGACPNRISRKAFACEVNAIRRANGLSNLKVNLRIRRAAQGWSRFQVASHNFAHEVPGQPTLVSRLKRSGYLAHTNDYVVGEVIAFGSGTAAQPAAIVSAWMHSPLHRDQLLNRAYREAGLGIVRGTPEGGPGYTFTLDLGRKY